MKTDEKVKITTVNQGVLGSSPREGATKGRQIVGLFLLCAVHIYYLEGASPLWGSVVTNH